MKTGAYFTILFMTLLCVALTMALVILGHANQKQQIKLQTQQQALNRGILGPQAQQLSNAMLQNLADVAVKDPEIRQLMEKHGYRITMPEPKVPVMDMSKSVGDDSATAGSPSPGNGDEAEQPGDDSEVMQ